jgi:hypothetical protein
MTPDDLMLVRRSWTTIRQRRAAFVARLAAAIDSTADADRYARRVVEAADELIDLLATPSALGVRARAIADTWPPALPLPRPEIDGAAWRQAASEVCAPWTSRDDEAWHRAWLLLFEVLAADALDPFEPPTGSAP